MILNWIVLFIKFYIVRATSYTSELRCNVRARVESGWVCGLLREVDSGVKYASFRGIPYAQQPLGNLRFKELQPVIPWSHHLDATEEGPICPQHDELYHDLVKPVMGMSESCIYANVHVPLEALPIIDRADDEFDVQYEKPDHGKGYPIFVFIHGGGFQAGSGNTDLHGPEYLVSKGFIVITFNYRLNVFGFLSLNTPEIPGNAGLRDQVTLLRWVQRNAESFGGDPHQVTIAGQSAGAASAHLLALSTQTEGLFKRVILMSGTAITAFYSASPVYANMIATQFLQILGINATNPQVIHDSLVQLPIETIINAQSELQKTTLVSFVPVVEAKYPGVTRIIDDDPFRLIQIGRDKKYPMIVGFANNEVQFFKRKLKVLRLLTQIKENPLIVLAQGIVFGAPPNVARYLAELVIAKYFHNKLNYEDYEVLTKDTLFEYPAFQLVRMRSEMHAAPSYLYQFAYESERSVLKAALNLEYKGSAHVEDLLYIFKPNAMSYIPRTNMDYNVVHWMTNYIVNFMQCDDPSCGESWPAVNPKYLNYQLVNKKIYNPTYPTSDEWDTICFHDYINEIGRNISTIRSYTEVCNTLGYVHQDWKS